MHCPYCADQPAIRFTPHCIDCGWSDRPLDGTSGLCSACNAWRSGDRPFPDLDAATLFFTAVVERAGHDRGSVRYRASAITPTFCDINGCDEWLFACGSTYVDLIRQHAEATEGDLIDVLLMVARIARDAVAAPLAA